MELIYAQIDPITGICFSVAQLSGAIIRDDMVPIANIDITILGQKWDGVKWITV